MEFKKYMHIERIGTDEVNGLEKGNCYVFYKIDGTNSSVWLKEDGSLSCGSRNRDLAIDNDNAGFMNYILSQEKFKKYLEKHPNHRLYGEWLVPHSLKTYRYDAWKKFYIFDIELDTGEMIPYEIYKPLLEEFEIDYVPPICMIKSPKYEDLLKALEKSGTFLVEDGKGKGEGIVVKNYNFYNQYGRQTWGKIVCNEFKEKHIREMGVDVINGTKKIEELIVDEFCTEAFIEKEYEKIVNANNGWTNKYIPQLLGIVSYEFIREETWNFVKKYKYPKIDFKYLNSCVIDKVKNVKKSIF